MLDLRRKKQTTVSSDGRVGEVLLDNTGRIRAVNQTAARLIGRPVGQLEGRPICDAVDNQGLRALMQYALISLDPVTNHVRCNDGADRLVRVEVRTVPDHADPQAAGLLCVLEAYPGLGSV